MRRALAVVLAIMGAAAVAAGALLVAVPLGLVVGGVEAVCAAYVLGYMEARRPE